MPIIIPFNLVFLFAFNKIDSIIKYYNITIFITYIV